MFVSIIMKLFMQKSVGELVKQQLMDVTSGMSARERNKARRKAKTLAKQRSKETSQR